ncbi:MAG TPA: ParB/RepB/Spo0J family partition protein [Terriglobales bacterium]|nr:ParB/RepB/Spo0J family partition protein [Terriglobales bacterium]
MITEKRKALGRGLESLLPSSQPVAAVGVAAPEQQGDGVREIPLEQIERNPYQTRNHTREAALDELAASIAASGVVQPIVVRRVEGGRFQIIAGERRWLASARAGKTAIPAIVKQVSNEQALEMTIIENLQREDLNPMEHARAFERLSNEFGLTQEEMARRTGKDRASIGNYMRLLKLPVTVQVEVESGALSFGHAKVLMSAPDAETMERLAAKVIVEGLSVRALEELVFRIEHPVEKQKKERAVDPNVRQAERDMQASLGMKVRIVDRKGRGKIVIEYGSLDDFDRVVTALAGK